MRRLAPEVDDLIVLIADPEFSAVGCYQCFEVTAEEEGLALLRGYNESA